jgi:hypothetical protein
LDTRIVREALNVRRQAVEALVDGRVRFMTASQARRIERLVSPRTADWLRGSPRWEDLTSGWMPSALIVPIILDGYERYGIAAVETMVGLPQRTLFRIATDSRGIHFAVADKIVVGLLGAGAWQEPPLVSWYYGVDAVLGKP